MSNTLTRNFRAAFEKLESFIAVAGDSEIERAGLIQAFEFTFEQAWKSLQKKAAGEGVAIASPKKAFEWAMQGGLISAEREELWIACIADRNLTSHTYREEMATRVVENLRGHYAEAFRGLLSRLEQ